MNAMRLPVKGEEGREKGAPCLFFRLVPGKTLLFPQNHCRQTVLPFHLLPSLFPQLLLVIALCGSGRAGCPLTKRV